MEGLLATINGMSVQEWLAAIWVCLFVTLAQGRR